MLDPVAVSKSFNEKSLSSYFVLFPHFLVSVKNQTVKIPLDEAPQRGTHQRKFSNSCSSPCRATSIPRSEILLFRMVLRDFNFKMLWSLLFFFLSFVSIFVFVFILVVVVMLLKQP